MEKVPKAVDFIKQHRKNFPPDPNITLSEWIAGFCIEFAKLHIQAAKEEIYEKARIIDDVSSWSGQAWDDGPLPQIIDKESITNAYPSSNIE